MKDLQERYGYFQEESRSSTAVSAVGMALLVALEDSPINVDGWKEAPFSRSRRKTGADQ